jgi:hypothetical protein
MKGAIRSFIFSFNMESFITIQLAAQRAALQRPGDNPTSGKLSMRGTLIPVRCKRLFGGAFA